MIWLFKRMQFFLPLSFINLGPFSFVSCCSLKADVAHKFLLRLYFRIPGLIKYLVDSEADKFLEKASTTGTVKTGLIVVGNML